MGGIGRGAVLGEAVNGGTGIAEAVSRGAVLGRRLTEGQD